MSRNIFFHKYNWVYYIILISIFKVLLVQNLPIVAYVHAVHDDRLMVDMALSIMGDNWLGDYSQMTLIKGVIFPMFLVICNYIGMPYLTGLTLFYIISCLMFIYMLNKVINKKLSLCVIYTVLLMNPISMATQTFLKVYRCSLTPAQVIMLITAFFALYYYVNKNAGKMCLWSTIAGISLFALWNTREDAIWIMPFVIVVTIIVAGKLLLNCTEKGFIVGGKLVVVLLPLLILFLGNHAISALNYSNYGIYTTNELNDSNFSKFIKTIYSVKPDENIEFVSVPRETIKKIYEVSPTLKDIEQYIEVELDEWEVHGKIPGDMEVEDGWFFWAMRDAVEAAGYYESADKAGEFYAKAAGEITSAIDEGRLEERMTMPSALMSPWREHYLSDLFSYIPQTLYYIISYNDVILERCVSYDSNINNWGVRLFEGVTNNLALYAPASEMNIRGWCFSKEDNITISLLNADGEYLQSVGFYDSNDVYELFLDNGINCETAKRCRFEISLPNLNENDFPLTFEIVKSSGEAIEVAIDEGHFDCGDILLQVDDMDFVEFEDPTHEYSKERIQLINKMNFIYAKISVFATFVGAVSYIYITYKYMRDKLNKKTDLEDIWLLLTGILGSLFVLIIGVTYTHISAYNAISPSYLSAAYPLLTMFSWVAIATVMEMIIGYYKRIKSNQTVEV